MTEIDEAVKALKVAEDAEAFSYFETDESFFLVYQTRRQSEGVQLIWIHNRMHGCSVQNTTIWISMLLPVKT